MPLYVASYIWDLDELTPKQMCEVRVLSVCLRCLWWWSVAIWPAADFTGVHVRTCVQECHETACYSIHAVGLVVRLPPLQPAAACTQKACHVHTPRPT